MCKQYSNTTLSQICHSFSNLLVETKRHWAVNHTHAGMQDTCKNLNALSDLCPLTRGTGLPVVRSISGMARTTTGGLSPQQTNNALDRPGKRDSKNPWQFIIRAETCTYDCSDTHCDNSHHSRYQRRGPNHPCHSKNTINKKTLSKTTTNSKQQMRNNNRALLHAHVACRQETQNLHTIIIRSDIIFSSMLCLEQDSICLITWQAFQHINSITRRRLRLE